MKDFVAFKPFALALALAATACANNPAQPAGDNDDDADPPPPPPPVVATLALAGNIVSCSNPSNARATAAIIDTLPPNTTIVALGDNVFPTGTLANFEGCYHNAWGHLKSRTRAAVGNHETMDAAGGHYAYFGAWGAGPAGKGWYSFDAGEWHVVVLNIHEGAQFGIDSEQMAWLRQDLASNSARQCTMAVWHDPRFLSSNSPGFNERSSSRHVWDALYEANVDVVVNGGQHQYERMHRMDPTGNIDNTRGILQINSGVGGHSWTDVSAIHPNQAAFRTGFGVLTFKLNPGSYDFTFVSSTSPGAGNDGGSGTCH